MLVLSRMRDQSIIIGDDIIIAVVDIRGDKVRLGITAPDHIRVDREEVRVRIDRGDPPRRPGTGRGLAGGLREGVDP